MAENGTIAARSYLFRADNAREEDGRWRAWVDALAGCATLGHTPAEAVTAVREAAQAHVDTLHEEGRTVPVDQSPRAANRSVASNSAAYLID